MVQDPVQCFRREPPGELLQSDEVDDHLRLVLLGQQPLTTLISQALCHNKLSANLLQCH